MRFLPPKTHTTHTRNSRLWRGFLVFGLKRGTGLAPEARLRGAVPHKVRKRPERSKISPLTGGKKGDTVIANSKRQRTGTVAAGRSQERGRMVQVPADAGGEGAWEPRDGNVPSSALVTGESAFSLRESEFRWDRGWIVIRPEAGKRLRGVFLLPRAVFHKILTDCVKGDKET